jgi:diaminopimelate epimerase
MSELQFSKYEGTGNDFIVVLDLEDELELTAEIAASVCDRRFGVGADGAIRLTRTTAEGLFFMDYRNSDGSVAETCGNGIRCAARFLSDRDLIQTPEFTIRTRAGQATVALLDEGRVRVAMGTPGFTKAAIPMRGAAWETFLGEPLDLGGGITVKASAVSMGNPHLVLFVQDDPDQFHVAHIGPRLESDDRFPEGTNVEFVRPIGDELVARVWERGSGETMACGSGACAAAVAANEAGLVPGTTRVHFPGGVLQVERRDDGEVFLIGPARHVFDGSVDPDLLVGKAEWA